MIEEKNLYRISSIVFLLVLIILNFYITFTPENKIKINNIEKNKQKEFYIEGKIKDIMSTNSYARIELESKCQESFFYFNTLNNISNYKNKNVKIKANKVDDDFFVLKEMIILS
jgi:hypothetical protein